jgi:hypothetical protein
MASIKIAVPTGGKDSDAFKQALKVSIAASTYNSPVEWVKGNFLQKGMISNASYRWKSYIGQQESKTDIERCECDCSV